MLCKGGREDDYQKKKKTHKRGLGVVPHTFKSKVGGRNRLISMNWRLAWST